MFPAIKEKTTRRLQVIYAYRGMQRREYVAQPPKMRQQSGPVP